MGQIRCLEYAPVILTTFLGIVLVAAPAQSTIKLAAPGLAYVNIDNANGEFYLDYFAKQIELRGIRVTTNKEISALVGFERQRQLLSCNEGSSCLAELAGALGVDGIITGSLAKVGKNYVLNIKVVDNEARSLAVYSERAKNEDALLDMLSNVALRLATQLKQNQASKTGAPVATKPGPEGKLEPKVEPKVEPKAEEPQVVASAEPEPTEAATVTRKGGGGSPALITGIASGAVLVGGATFFTLAQVANNRLTTGDKTIASYGEAQKYAQQGRVFETVGWSMMGAGVVGLGVAGVMMLTGAPPSEAPHVSVVPLAQGAAVSFGGRF